MNRPKVFVCSPYRGHTDANLAIARCLTRWIAYRGEAPFTPHLYLPLVLDDGTEQERAMGIMTSLGFLTICNKVVAYIGKGISSGMRSELTLAGKLQIEVETVTDLRFAGLRDTLFQSEPYYWTCMVCEKVAWDARPHTHSRLPETDDMEALRAQHQLCLELGKPGRFEEEAAREQQEA